MLFRISIRSAIFLFTITFYPKLTSYLVKIDHISIHCLIIWFYLFSWTQTISWIILIFWSIFAMWIKWFLIILIALIKQNITYLQITSFNVFEYDFFTFLSFWIGSNLLTTWSLMFWNNFKIQLYEIILAWCDIVWV